MTLQQTIQADAVAALKGGDKLRSSRLRLVLSELQKAAKEGRDDEQTVLRRELKRRRESAEAYGKAGRMDLAQPEEAEAKLIQTYLPQPLSEGDVMKLVADTIISMEADSPKQMGQVIKAVMESSQGRAEGKLVSTLVREALS